jgi:hypothetical protein
MSAMRAIGAIDLDHLHRPSRNTTAPKQVVFSTLALGSAQLV